jgi:hypothetical protein
MKSLVSAMLVLAAIAGCGGMTAEMPMTVSLGLSRDAAISQLHAHQYCPLDAAADARERTFPRCDRTGTEWGDSWVTARFDKDTLVELRRWERFVDDAHAVARWNQLVTDREKLTPESPEAAEALRVNGLLVAGTRTVKAFRIDDKTIVGVYLLTPSPPEDASVLEKIVYVTRLAQK